jgi:hypothetical protein
MKSKFIFLIFSLVLLSGFIFSATPADPPVINSVFSVDIVLPNPYYGLIVADASNLANTDSVSSNSIQNNAVVLSKIGASNPGANKFLKINSTGNSLEWGLLTKEIISEVVTLPPSASGIRNVFCPEGSVVTGGGFNLQQGTNPPLYVLGSYPDVSTSSWECSVENPNTISQNYTCYAICVK